VCAEIQNIRFGIYVIAQNPQDFEQLIAKYKLQNTKYKTGMEMGYFDFNF